VNALQKNALVVLYDFVIAIVHVCIWTSSSTKSALLPLSMEIQKQNTWVYRKNEKFTKCAWCGNIKSDDNFTFVMSRLRIIRNEEYFCTNYIPTLLECVVCSKCMKWYIPVNLVEWFPTRIERPTYNKLLLPRATTWNFHLSHTNIPNLFAILIREQRDGSPEIKVHICFRNASGNYHFYYKSFRTMLPRCEFRTGNRMKIKNNGCLEFEFEFDI
jgi:hypothetical protein